MKYLEQEVNRVYLIDKEKKVIVDYLKKKLAPKFIYLFGSFARGEGREDSDIDLAVYTDKKASAYDLFMNLSMRLATINKLKKGTRGRGDDKGKAPRFQVNWNLHFLFWQKSAFDQVSYSFRIYNLFLWKSIKPSFFIFPNSRDKALRSTPK